MHLVGAGGRSGAAAPGWAATSTTHGCATAAEARRRQPRFAVILIGSAANQHQGEHCEHRRRAEKMRPSASDGTAHLFQTSVVGEGVCALVTNVVAWGVMACLHGACLLVGVIRRMASVVMRGVANDAPGAIACDGNPKWPFHRRVASMR